MILGFSFFLKNTWLYMVCDKLRDIPLTQKHGIFLSYLAFILSCTVVYRIGTFL